MKMWTEDSSMVLTLLTRKFFMQVISFIKIHSGECISFNQVSRDWISLCSCRASNYRSMQSELAVGRALKQAINEGIVKRHEVLRAPSPLPPENDQSHGDLFLWRFDSGYEYACNVRMTRILQFMWWKFLRIWMIIWIISENFSYSDYIYTHEEDPSFLVMLICYAPLSWWRHVLQEDQVMPFLLPILRNLFA